MELRLLLLLLKFSLIKSDICADLGISDQTDVLTFSRSESCFSAHFKDYKNFDDCEATCQLKGGHLAFVTAEIVDFIRNNQTIKNKFGYNYWTGLKPNASGWDWAWDASDGTFIEAVRIPWKPAQPNFLRDQDCVATASAKVVTLNDLPCKNKYRCLCEYHRVTDICAQLHIHANIRAETEIFSYENWCFELHHNKETFADAGPQCTYQSNGHLAFLNIEEKYEALIQKWPQAGENEQKYWIGLGQMENSIEPDQGWYWMWGDGYGYNESINLNIGIPWNETQPDHASNDEQCAVLISGSKLHDHNCTDKLNFICEYEEEEQQVPCETWGLTNFTKYHHSCYKVIKDLMPFHDALAECQKEIVNSTHGLKARLAFIIDRGIQNFLEELQLQADENSAFIGLKSLEGENSGSDFSEISSYVWSEDGEVKHSDVGYRPLDVSQRDFIYPFHYCAVMCRDGCERKRKWRARHCNWPSSSFCEIYKV